MHFFRLTVKPESDELVSADFADGATVLEDFSDDPVFLHSSPSPIGYVFSLPGQISPFRVKYTIRLSQIPLKIRKENNNGAALQPPRE